MNELELNFTIFTPNHDTIDNSIIYEIRKELSRLLHQYGFGSSIELNDDRFMNEYAIPSTDAYFEPENDLFIAFTWLYPLAHGDIRSITEELLPDFTNYVMGLNQQLIIHTRLFFR